MSWRTLTLPLLAAASLLAAGPGPLTELGFRPPADPVRATLPPAWRELRFESRPRPTIYRVVGGASSAVLLAQSAGGASILYTSLPPGTPGRELCWEWRVDHVPAGADLRRPETDDVGARVSVGFRYSPELVPRGQRIRYALARLRHGETPPYAGLVYVWTAAPASGTTFVHPNWPRLGVVVLHDAAEPLASWRHECRDLEADYRAIFGSTPPEVSHVGVITDADDTRSRATGRYRNLTLGPLPSNGTTPSPPRKEANHP